MSLLCTCRQLTLDWAHWDHLEAWSTRHVVIHLRHTGYTRLTSNTTELRTWAVRSEQTSETASWIRASQTSTSSAHQRQNLSFLASSVVLTFLLTVSSGYWKETMNLVKVLVSEDVKRKSNLPGMFYAEAALFNYYSVAVAGGFEVISGVSAFFCSCSSDICSFSLDFSLRFCWFIDKFAVCAIRAIANKINKLL